MLSHCAWVGMRLMLQETTWTHENITNMEDYLINDLLGHIYEIQRVDVASYDLGWPDQRIRAIRNAQHKTKTHGALEPWAVVCELFNRKCEITWREYFVATEADLEENLAWARGRSASSRRCGCEAARPPSR